MKQHEQALLYLKKASEDETLLDKIIDQADISDEIFGFHCQQAAEKILKAILSEMGIHFRKTHDLRELMDMLTDNHQPIPSHLNDIETLTPFGTTFRYDCFDDSSPFDRQKARHMVRDLRAWVEKLVMEK